MKLQITTTWEHDIFGATEGTSHLVVSIVAQDIATKQRAPIDLAFALDRSGSMSGPNKLELVKDAVLAAVDQLQDTDRVALVIFDDEISTLHRLTPLDHAHRSHLVRVTKPIRSGGGTNLSAGWLEACRQLSDVDTGTPRIRRTLLLTDGQANVGITNPQELAKHARELRDRGISTSAIGVGAGFDEFLLSNMAESGGGAFQYIAHASELEAFFSGELRGLADMVALNPFVDITLPRGMRAELINAFPGETHHNNTSVDLRDLAAGEQVHLVFAVTSRHIREEAVAPKLHVHWVDAHSGSVQEINEVGAKIAIGDATAGKRNETAAAIVALELAARDHREAVRLDRAGDHRGRQQRFHDSAERLRNAPHTAEVEAVLYASMSMEAMPDSFAMPEHDRKMSVHQAHKRSRGGRAAKEADAD